MTKETGLTPKLLEVAQMLASGMTYSQISEAVNAPRSTVGRWAKLESVEAQVSTLKNEAQQACQDVSRDAATSAAKLPRSTITRCKAPRVFDSARI